MKDLIQQISHNGYMINIYPDNDACNPRKEWDNAGTMVCFHRRYDLGDKHNFDSPEDFIMWARKRKTLIVLPLFLYDHSGITMSTGSFSCQWDSGQVGWIYITAKDAIKNWGRKGYREKAIKYLEGEVETYDNFITGSVYGYMIGVPDDPDSDEPEYTEEGGCWGFYGYDHEKSGLFEQAKGEIDYMVRQAAEEAAAEAVRELIRVTSLQPVEVY